MAVVFVSKLSGSRSSLPSAPFRIQNLQRSENCFGAGKCGRGLPQSKTLRDARAAWEVRQVLECASPSACAARRGAAFAGGACHFLARLSPGLKAVEGYHSPYINSPQKGKVPAGTHGFAPGTRRRRPRGGYRSVASWPRRAGVMSAPLIPAQPEELVAGGHGRGRKLNHPAISLGDRQGGPRGPPAGASQSTGALQPVVGTASPR